MAEEQVEETRDLLSAHDTIATFVGVTHRPCRFLTSMCPDRCNHPTDWAEFSIERYLSYEKPGEYGDEQQTKWAWDVKSHGVPNQEEFKAKVAELKPGQKVRLTYRHEYVHRGGAHFPQRPLVRLDAVTEEEAAAATA